MTIQTVRRPFTLTIMTHPRPLTVTCSHLEAQSHARTLAATSGQPVYLSWLNGDGTRHEERITQTTIDRSVSA